jgi:phytoene dehydrogenase-like protein
MNTASEVIVIGGGVSGLSAAYELEKQGISYTLIEVKPRLGGHVISTQQNGFVMDGGAFAFPVMQSWQTLEQLGLEDSLYELESPYKRNLMAFKQGTQTLVDALEASLSNRIIKRMAVTSLGIAESGGFYVCLENGLALQAKGIVVAIPAKYAERLFWSMQPDVSEALQNYHYDHVTRVALGFSAKNVPEQPPTSPPDVIFSELNSTNYPGRVPPGGLLVQAAVRVPLQNTTPEMLVQSICVDMGWKHPNAIFVNYWGESDPLTISAPSARLLQLNDMLPAGVQLVGGCYQPLALPQRTDSARDVTRNVLAALNT